jgi:hypothetical protein
MCWCGAVIARSRVVSPTIAVPGFRWMALSASSGVPKTTAS